MKKFVIRQNIERYIELLRRRDLEEHRRRLLERLLAEERAKLAAYEEADSSESHPDSDRSGAAVPQRRQPDR